jgi:pimeloyl-ACP methyl ester carboxylesterase
MNVDVVPVDRSSAAPVPKTPRVPKDLVDPTSLLRSRFRPPASYVTEGAQRAIDDTEKALCAAVGAHADRLEAGTLGRALADLCVTGRRARANWNEWRKKNDRTSFARLGASIPGASDAARKSVAWTEIFDRIESVIAHVDAPDGVRKPFMPLKGSAWIATHSVLDVPHGPVNTTRTSARQRHIDLKVPQIGPKPFSVRYTVVGELAPGKKAIVYLHGLGSRAEEGEAIAKHLTTASSDYVIVAPDLPWNGYTTAPCLDAGALGLNYDWDGTPGRRFPALEALEAFVIAFIRAVPDLEKSVVCVAGGSLGGTLTMRLSLETSKWRPPRAAMWSPAGLWEPQNTVAIKHKEVCGRTFGLTNFAEYAGAPPDVAALGSTRYFDFNFTEDHQPFTGLGFQSWWSAKFLDSDIGKSHENGAIDDRLELYRETLRRMQFRLAYEQLCFSMRTPDRLDHVGGASDTPSERPLLLLCGTEDNQSHVNIFDRMKDLAHAKRNQTGHAVWIEGAGHSLHDECPAQVAKYLASFVEST